MTQLEIRKIATEIKILLYAIAATGEKNHWHAHFKDIRLLALRAERGTK